MSGVPSWFKYLCVLSVVVGVALALASLFFLENGPETTFVLLLLIGIALACGCCLVDWNVHEEKSGEFAPGSGWAADRASACFSCRWCWGIVHRGNRIARAESGLRPLREDAPPVEAPFAQVMDVSKLRI